METETDDEVKVWAFFDPSSRRSLGQAGIFPIAMSWNRRFVKFERVIFASVRRVGDTRFVDLVCASEAANFQLEFDSNNYCWKIKKVMAVDG